MLSTNVTMHAVTSQMHATRRTQWVRESVLQSHERSKDRVM